MRGNVLSVAIAVTGILSAVAGAQSGAGRMAEQTGHDMEMAKTVTYTGCLQAGAMDAKTFVLAHPAMADQDHKAMMMKDSKMAMPGHDMAGKDMAQKDMAEKDMAPLMLMVTGSAIDLRKHVGHKVSVTGSLTKGGAMNASAGEGSTLAIKSLKMVAKSCL